MRLLFLIPLIILSVVLRAQPLSIGGQVNEYYAVSAIAANQVTCTGEDLSNLQPGDKVILFQVTGGMIDTTVANFPRVNGALPNYAGAGRFEYLAVNTVNNLSKVVTFTANVKRTYDINEKVQLIKIVESEIISVDSEVNAMPWNGTKGGVVALVGFKKVILNADVDVSGQGFRGGTPELYAGGCRLDYDPDTFYFKNSVLDKAAEKGEGIFAVNFEYTKGQGHALNGGGGGNGLYSGGGGGALLTAGGRGDYEEWSCSHATQQYARGGGGLPEPFFTRDYEIAPDEKWPAISFGGGGGTSTQTSTGISTSGGNGGGVIIILTDTLEANGHSIISNGNSVTEVASGGAGGGGAGGAIIIDADYIKNTLNVLVKGGNGGSVNADSGNCGGVGGGGSGGLLWHNGTVISASISDTLTAGVNGSKPPCGDNYGFPGQAGSILNNYLPLLNGFTFNAVTGDDTICAGQTPIEIIGSTPKGVASPTYKWLISDDNVNWSVISGESAKDYQPGALTASKYFTRVVTNDDGYSDTAFSAFVKVYPVISGNQLTLTDTICSGVVRGLLSANSVSGGNSTFSYIWESTDNPGISPWINRGTDEILNETTALTQTTFYRRIVESAKVCSDTSSIDSLTVLPPILANSMISPDTTICAGLDGGTIRANSPGGGDGSYSFEWRVSNDNSTYASLGGSNTNDYSPGILTANTWYYKRVVFSGNDNACRDTSSAHLITSLPVIQNFGIVSDSVRYCYNDTPKELKSTSTITGGNGSYSFQWLVMNGVIWEEINGATNESYFPPALTDTMRYKRSIISGADNACRDTSNNLVISVMPEIINNLSSSPDDICENSAPQAFNETSASGGAGGFTYVWEKRTDETTSYSEIPGANATSYTSGNLTDTTYFRRLAKSQICTDTSNDIEVIVYPSIRNNFILGAATQYVCSNSDKELSGQQPGGGDGTANYSYSWQSSADGTSWSVINGANNIDFISEPLTEQTLFRRIARSGSQNQCSDTSSAVTVNINPLPTGELVSAYDTLCQSDNIEISYHNLTGAAPWTISVGEDVPLRTQIVQESNGTLTFPIESSTNFRILSLEDDSSCFADTSFDDTRLVAYVYDLPVAFAGESKSVCGNETQMTAAYSVENSYGNWFIDGGSVSPDSTPDGTLTVDEFGEYNIIWRESTSSDCYSEDEITINFYEQPVEIDAGEDIEKDYSFVHQLNAQPTGVGNGYWTYISGDGMVTFDDSTSNTAVVTLSDIGTYTLAWNVENGVCETISDELVITNNEQQLYEGFSPNGDDINDTYVIKLQEGNSGTLTILDRNGRIVKTRPDVNSVITWDGTGKSGNDLPDGTYYYILEEIGDPSIPTKTGFIELRR